MIILGIESSCDETAAAIIEAKGTRIRVLSSVVSSQIETFKGYGGVIPEVAARKHILMIIPVIDETLKKSGIILPSPRRKESGRAGAGLDAIAVTAGPGLATSLMVGVETAKALAFAWQLPLIAVNHIEGHIYANWLEPAGAAGNSLAKQTKTSLQFPALVLTVSGGHTMLVLMTDYGKYKTIGETRDDAAGEAFDKAARILGLGYPGGPAIAAEAAKFSNHQSQITLPRPMINSGNYEFSFSGLKTALLYKVQKDQNWKKHIPEYAAEFQQAIIDVLIAKTLKAADEYKVKTIMLSGGVSANKELRQKMDEAIKNKIPNSKFQIPNSIYSTDNAAMIAAAGYFQSKGRGFSKPEKVIADPGLRL
ncbi:MAG: tRNA (adenosine(37)-N6)-threonylcarbamoyltransferase complex transferase subunit TsaD [Patescibacteria group bacterium]|jgi:N6-L-threonylcarbamoyladenine synthase